MNEVSCRCTASIITALVSRGVDPGHLAHGLPFGLERIEDASARIPWDEFIQILENCAEIVGGPDGVEEICSTFYPQHDGLLREFASQMISPRALYHMGARWYGPWLYPCTQAKCEDLPDGRIRQTIEIRPDHADSELFFRAMSGGLQTVPALLGMPPAKVKMERGPHKATFFITPPRVGRIERIRRMLRRRRGAVAGADAELTLRFEELQQGYEQARVMTAELDETTRRLDEERGQREQIEQVLQQAQKLDTMGRLAGGIAHDFNNVLTAISGYADLALDQLEEGHPVHDDVAEIQDVAERGAALVQQILSFTRRQEVRPRKLELNQVTLRMESLLARLLPDTIELQIFPAREPLPVIADPSQMEQVVVNLVINSRDAMPGGGQVRIDLARKLDAGRGEVAELVLSDTGRGMDEQTASRAFEPFFTTKARDKGTGIGLATVHSIVTRSGGHIAIESRVGAGTVVSIQWPIADESRQARELDPEETPPGGTETVLVVEDDELVRGVIERTLAAAGYTVLSAAEGQTAMELARSHPRAIELLVADLGLPADDGAALAARISELRAELRGALLLTGTEPEGTIQTSRSNQVNLAKPFERAALLRAAREVLDA